VIFIVKKQANPQGNLFSTDFRTQNTWFCRPRTTDQEDITRKIMQQGEVDKFNGKMTGNLGITHENVKYQGVYLCMHNNSTKIFFLLQEEKLWTSSFKFSNGRRNGTQKREITNFFKRQQRK
jgi:hypothetical protein